MRTRHRFLTGFAVVVWTWTGVGVSRTPQDPVPPPSGQAPAPAQGSLIPDGPGKALFVRVCTKCHAFERVALKRAEQAEWQAIINNMVVRGAEVNTEEEFYAIAEYLGEHLAPTIKVNTAGAIDFQLFFGLAKDEAAALVEYRTRQGPFRSFADLTGVPGIDLAKVSPLRDAIVY